MLGFNTDSRYNLANQGCLLTVVAAFADVTPDVMNEALKNVNGFVGGGLMVFGKIEAACRGAHAPHTLFFTGITNPHRDDAMPAADLEDIHQRILRKAPVLIEVSFDPWPRFRQHFLGGVGYDPTQGIMVHDPWLLPEEQKVVSMRHYGKTNAVAMTRAVYLEIVT